MAYVRYLEHCSSTATDKDARDKYSRKICRWQFSLARILLEFSVSSASPSSRMERLYTEAAQLIECSLARCQNPCVRAFDMTFRLKRFVWLFHDAIYVPIFY